MQQGPLGTPLDLLAQIADHHVDDVGPAIPVHAPDVLGNQAPRERSTRAPHQELEQREFLRRQLDISFPATDPAGHRVERQIRNDERVRAEDPARRSRRANTRTELARVERLRQIVVGPPASKPSVPDPRYAGGSRFIVSEPP